MMEGRRNWTPMDHASAKEEKPDPEKMHRFFMKEYLTSDTRPAIDDFPYAAEVKKKDKFWVDERRQGAQPTSGKLVEAFLRTELHDADWFGASVFETTLFDDYQNGVDAVLEWDRGSETLPVTLAVDFTGGSDAKIIARKLQQSLGRTEVKYFHTDFPERRGSGWEFAPLKGIPKIILGIDVKMLSRLEEFAYLHRQQKNGNGLPTVHRDRTAFQNHPLSYLLLEQAQAQLVWQSVLVARWMVERDRAYGTDLQPLAPVLQSKDTSLAMAERLAEVWGSLPSRVRSRLFARYEDDPFPRRLGSFKQVCELVLTAQKNRVPMQPDVQEWRRQSKTHGLLTHPERTIKSLSEI